MSIVEQEQHSSVHTFTKGSRQRGGIAALLCAVLHMAVLAI